MSVRTDIDGPVWTVRLHRPEARNAVDPATAAALHEAFVAFDEDGDARVAVLHGEGGAFCSGWDLKHAAGLAELDDEQLHRELVEPLAVPSAEVQPAPPTAIGPTRLELSKPVIAAIEGPAVAGGMELAIWADVRVMASTAYLGVFCRRWGVPLVDGGTVRLPRLVGLGRALEIAMTGRRVDAEECLRIGLCERVVDEGGALAAAQEMAREIARFPQMALRADRLSMIETYGVPVREALRHEWERGFPAVLEEGLTGAGRFAAGLGRGGDTERI